MKIFSKIVTVAALGLMALAPVSEAKTFLKFTGGPSGGTFQYFSNGMAIRLSKNLSNVKISNQSSRGSVENIRKVNSKRADMGIAYSGDLFLAREGRLSGDTKKYGNVRAVAFLYKAPGQLAVLKNSGIKKVMDLAGKKVALGGAGSGAAASGERFFKLVGLWNKIDRQFLGYSKAAAAMKDGHVDAMWILSGFPTRALIELAATKDIRLLHLYETASAAGLEKSLPFYQPLFVPSNTYEGVPQATTSFFDSALWVVHKSVSADIIYKALKDIFSKDGLKYLVNVKSTAKQMSVKGGVTGIVTTLHPGAERFWKEMGLTIPATISAK